MLYQVKGVSSHLGRMMNEFMYRRLVHSEGRLSTVECFCLQAPCLLQASISCGRWHWPEPGDEVKSRAKILPTGYSGHAVPVARVAFLDPGTRVLIPSGMFTMACSSLKILGLSAQSLSFFLISQLSYRSAFWFWRVRLYHLLLRCFKLQ